MSRLGTDDEAGAATTNNDEVDSFELISFGSDGDSGKASREKAKDSTSPSLGVGPQHMPDVNNQCGALSDGTESLTDGIVTTDMERPHQGTSLRKYWLNCQPGGDTAFGGKEESAVDSSDSPEEPTESRAKPSARVQHLPNGEHVSRWDL